MTKIFNKKWSIITGTSISVTLLASVLALGVLSPQAEAEDHLVALPGTRQCGIDPRTGERLQILHFDKIIFENGEDLLNGKGGLVEEGSIMDIKVLDDPNRIEFPMEKAVQKLNNAGWTTDEGEPITLEDLELIDVEYAIVCAFGDRFDHVG